MLLEIPGFKQRLAFDQGARFIEVGFLILTQISQRWETFYPDPFERGSEK